LAVTALSDLAGLGLWDSGAFFPRVFGLDESGKEEFINIQSKAAIIGKS